MFSGNYLGVHTPQDVLVGFAATAVMLVLGNRIEKWSDQDPDRRDKIILVGGLLLAAAAAIYYLTKSYPMDYNADGSLIVNPAAMLPDSFEGVGFVSAYSVCRYFERRGVAFDEVLSWKDRFIIGTVSLIPVLWWHTNIVNIFAQYGLKALGKFCWAAGIIVYVTVIVPQIMKKVHDTGVLAREH